MDPQNYDVSDKNTNASGKKTLKNSYLCILD